MKNFFLILVVMVVFSVRAENTAATDTAQAESCRKPEKFDDSPHPYPGSRSFQECYTLSGGQLKNLYKDGRRSTSQFQSWEPYISYACKAVCEKEPDLKTCKESKIEIAKKCESIAFVMSFYERDWESTEQTKEVRAKSDTSEVGVTPRKAIKCISEGIETLDYIGCKKFAANFENINIAQTTIQGAQELIYAGKMMDASVKYAKEENAATGALKATGDSLAKQQDMYQERTAIDSTKLMYLYTLYDDIPRLDDMREKCKDIQKATEVIQSVVPVKADDCKQAVLKGFALAQNQDQLDIMKRELFAIATSLGSNIVLANLTGKRADSVNKAIAQIDGFKPTDPSIMTEEDTLTTFCKLNPGAEKCLTSDLSRTFDSINDNIITFGEGGTGTNYTTPGRELNTPTTDSGSIASPKKTVTPVGSIIASIDKDNSIEGSKGATVSAGKAPSGGGGGGGSGGGSGGGGGGGTPPPPAQGGVSAAVQGKTPTYAGGAGSISVVGGLGLNKAKGEGKSEDNPFGKLFGKDTPKGTGVVNFRDIASQRVGDKSEDIFHMISKRYSSVAADKRLLEYELAK